MPLNDGFTPWSNFVGAGRSALPITLTDARALGLRERHRFAGGFITEERPSVMRPSTGIFRPDGPAADRRLVNGR
jgi:hypothetical protein